MLNGVLLTIGLIFVLLSRFLYCLSETKKEIIVSILVDLIGTLSVVMAICTYYGFMK